MFFQKQTALRLLPSEARDAVAERVDSLFRVENIPYRVKEVFSKEVFSDVVDAALEDLAALVCADPAARQSWCYALESYRCLEAVFTYRVAHQIVNLPVGDGSLSRQDELLTFARALSERARVFSGVEIHPCAQIGKRFIVDHGTGTVIGETVVIGNDCYILQGVILGSSGVAYNPAGARHPMIGNGVQIGAFTRIFGNISIGDNVFIGSHCTITKDVSAGMTVVSKASDYVRHQGQG